MTIIYDKNEFLKRFRKVKFGQITEPLTDSYWRNNLARARKKAIGEHAPESTIVFHSLDDPQIDVEQTLKRNRNLWIVDDKGNPVNLPGVDCPVESITRQAVVENNKAGFDFEMPEISLHEETEVDYPEYPALWIGGDWAPYTSRADHILNTVEFELWEHEQGRYSDLDVLSVIVESVCEHLQVVEDYRTGKKYKTKEMIEGDDPISIDSKKRAVEYCKRLISQLEKDIEQLKAGTYYPDFDEIEAEGEL